MKFLTKCIEWPYSLDASSRLNHLQYRLHEAKHRFEKVKKNINRDAQEEIEDHLNAAGLKALLEGDDALLDRKMPFEIRLRELFRAERELLRYLDCSRCAAATADLRTDIAIWVPEAR